MTPESWRTIGHGLLYAGLVGELALIFVPERKARAMKIVSVTCALLVIVGIAFENRATFVLEAPRSIGAVDALTMSTELRAFPKNSNQVDVLSRVDSPDAEPFRDQLAAILRDAGWNTSRGIIGSTDRPTFNVLIELGPTAQPVDTDAAQALTEKLNRLGVVTTFTGEQRPKFTGVGSLNEKCRLSITISPRG